MVQRRMRGMNDVAFGNWRGDYGNFLQQPSSAQSASRGWWRVGDTTELFGRFGRGFADPANASAVLPLQLDPGLWGGLPFKAASNAKTLTFRLVFFDGDAAASIGGSVDGAALDGRRVTEQSSSASTQAEYGMERRMGEGPTRVNGRPIASRASVRGSQGDTTATATTTATEMDAAAFAVRFDSTEGPETLLTVTKTGSGKWREICAAVSGAKFGRGGPDGADIWLANLGSSTHSVTVFDSIEIAEGSFEELAMQGCDFNEHEDAAHP